MTSSDAVAGDERAGATQVSADRAVCTPCRGTGTVISNLGGEPHEVACPWCEGSGKFIPEHDAQAAPGERAAS